MEDAIVAKRGSNAMRAVRREQENVIGGARLESETRPEQQPERDERFDAMWLCRCPHERKAKRGAGHGVNVTAAVAAAVATRGAATAACCAADDRKRGGGGDG